MSNLSRLQLTLLACSSVGWFAAAPINAKEPTARRGAIATVHPIATNAAVEVYRDGGNAVDAAVAAALTLGVVDGHNSGIGGGCLILVRRPDGSLLAIDGRETAPAAARRDMYLRDGKADPELSQTGPLAVATPGAVAAYDKLLKECGSLTLARLLEPGRQAAERGFRIDRNLASNLEHMQKVLARFPGSAEALFGADGSPPKAGQRFQQPDLAHTYSQIAEHGVDWFYQGEFADRVGEWMQHNGGILTAKDFNNYRPKVREPIESTYRGYTIIGFPPPSSGGVHIAQMLNILEGFDVLKVYANSESDGIHLVAEAMKLAFADRAYWLGDPDFVEVPRGLASKEYAKTLAAKISLEQAISVDRHGQPPQWRQDLFGRHTTHIAAADSNGYWVAITATINTSFGSKIVVPGTGVVLNNEMDDFSIHPGTPNAFGLVGAENNSVAPGKRPLSSMSPTIVLDPEGEPLLTVGAAGGPKIITQTLGAIVATLDRHMSPEAALAQPRFHHQWRPDKLSVERTVPKSQVEALRAKGHDVDYLSSAARVQMIVRDKPKGFIAVHDPRIEGKAAVEPLPAVRSPVLQPAQ